jgi:hypothetical protein
MSDPSRTCFEAVPRERWAEHPRFPSQTLLLGSHRNFRELSKLLVAAASPLEVRQRLFDQWQGAMRSHEAYEEHKLYPFLRHRFGVQTAVLEAGHQTLHAIESELRAAFRDGDDARWAARMRRYDVVLHEHLRDEEDLVIPCLLALEPREFTAYYHGTLSELIADTPACAC